MSYNKAEPVSSGDTAGRTDAGLHLPRTAGHQGLGTPSRPGVTRTLPRRRSLAKTETVPHATVTSDRHGPRGLPDAWFQKALLRAHSGLDVTHHLWANSSPGHGDRGTCGASGGRTGLVSGGGGPPPCRGTPSFGVPTRASSTPLPLVWGRGLAAARGLGHVSGMCRRSGMATRSRFFSLKQVTGSSGSAAGSDCVKL